MNLSELNAVPIRRNKRKRVGRGPGTGHGKTSGRGHNGQKSRSGYSRRYGFEGGQMPLFRRLPKKGFNNARFRIEYAIVNVGQLENFEDGAEVDLDALRNAQLVQKKAERLKVLGKGTLSRRLVVKAHKFSASARQMIEAAGGSVEEVGAK